MWPRGRSRPLTRTARTLRGLRAVRSIALAALLTLGAVVTAAAPPRVGDLTGQLLVATDELRDPRFVRTVVYMVRHDAGGAMGLVVNRPLGQVPLAVLLERLGMEGKAVGGEMRVHYGGPVETARGFVLHTSDYVTQGTQVVRDGIALTAQPEIFRAIGAGAGPRRTLFALGYAGWAPGQLEAEIRAGAWITVPADEGLMFDEHFEKKWNRAMARRRFDL
ncbi:MAG: YqgE/AlgH family protein [candidate division NC10 bacterium]|nr:YqgE/AlgH family protein [candidate division NC10 bacterium]